MIGSNIIIVCRGVRTHPLQANRGDLARDLQATNSPHSATSEPTVGEAASHHNLNTMENGGAGAKVYVPDDAHGWVGATLLRVDRAAGTAEVEIEPDAIFGIAGGETRTVSLAHPLLQACRGGGEDDGSSSLLPLQNLGVPEEGMEDMAALSFLHVSRWIEILEGVGGVCMSVCAAWLNWGGLLWYIRTHTHETQEPAILFNLRRRFLAHQPYTYTGEICISVRHC